jgi:AraC family transcriptional regulator, chitin signaling transcriptional activator
MSIKLNWHFRKQNIYIVCILFCLLPWKLQSQSILPFIENYTKQNYKGDNQIWDMVQGVDNAMYFANNLNLVRFDGVRWEKYNLPSNTVIRSIFAKDEKIYTGSVTEFGYWIRKNGKMLYKSLVVDSNLFKGYSNNEEIWKIFELNGNIYFQTFNELYIFKNNKIKKLKFPSQISYCFVVNNQILAATINNGIFELRNDFEFIHRPEWDELKGKIIHHIDFKNNQYYFFTRNNGIFIFRDNKLFSWTNPLNFRLKSEIINTASFNADNLLIGTAFNGIYIIDMISSSYININRKSTLQNNSVLCIEKDSENDIWLGLDNGIAHIELNTPIKLFTDLQGQLGSVYCISNQNNNLILGSNHGLFKYENEKLELINNSQGQVWKIFSIDSLSSLIGHNDGTFILKNDELKLISKITGGWQIKKDLYSDNLIMSHYSGIDIINNFSNNIKNKRLEINPIPIKDFIQSSKNEIIFYNTMEGFYKVKFDDTYDNPKLTKLLNSINRNYALKVFNFKNENLFYANNQWFSMDKINEKLQIYPSFNDNFKNINDIIPIEDSLFAIIKNEMIQIVQFTNGRFEKISIPKKYYHGRIINNETKIFRKDGKYFINLDDGFMILESIDFKPKNNKVKIEAFIGDEYIENQALVPNNSNITINFITGHFGQEKGEINYSINGGKKQSTQNNTLEINNLSGGEYIIEAFKINNGEYIKIGEFRFDVKNPWFLTSWMIIVYISIIILILIIYYRWTKIRFNVKLRIKEEELKHQNKLVQLQMQSENQMKIKEFEKDALKTQISMKANELASKSLYLAKQTELIEKILSILDRENNIQTIKSKISTAIKTIQLNKNEWKSFENNLLKSNEDFVEILTAQFPSLTSKDIKLCIYLKMNLSSKEIAPLMNISFRGVELHRYRLRKKLDLSAEKNLNSFINTLK